MNLFKKSFIKRIMVLIFVFNVIFIILFTSMTYIITKSNTEGNITSITDNSMSAAVGAVDNYVRQAGTALRLLRGCDAVRDGSDFSAIEEEIDLLCSSGTGFMDMWYLSASGEAVSSEGKFDGIALADYSWYSDAEMTETEQVRVYLKSDSVQSILDNDAGPFMITSVIESGEFKGCVGSELSCEALGSSLAASMFSEGVYAIISDRTGNVVCMSGAPTDVDDLFYKSDYTISSLISDINGGNDITHFSNGRTDNYVKSCTLSVGWKLIVIYDGEIADGSFYKMYAQQIIVLACLFVLELIATLNVIRHEAKDIPEISSSIAEISAGNYNFRINSSSENEIGLIAKSVDALAAALQEKTAVIDDFKTIDPTTGLQNRYKMYEYIEDLSVSRDETRKRFALLFIDIDNFKWITETLGHRQGDEFLKIFGRRLKSVVPKVFRFSGDVFVIITEFNDDYGIIEELIANLRKEFNEPIEILNDKLYAQFSVGISVYPDDDTNLDMLLRDADIAVSRAKEKGKGRTAYYNAALHSKVLSKATIAQKLNSALANNEMSLCFQPIISVKNGEIHGFEALVRWESEELGAVPPFTFVQVAEETGAIVDIGTWIFETGCRYLKRMNELNSNIIMSINVSPVQLKKKNFFEKVVRTIEVFDINPKNLQIEITETSLVDFVEGGNDVIKKLADLGIALALDDFGTGYSSFGYLKDMPIKTLKVDKSFVDEICNKHKDYQITGSIIDMVRNLGLKTVVEGVETIEQYNILSEMGCDYIQGFLMSKPLNANDAMEFVLRYDELHRPNRQTLEENSSKLAAERRENEGKQQSEDV